MSFYPRTLKSQWYMADVCDSIFTSLEAIKQITVLDFENKIEREAYLDAFQTCQEMVHVHDLKPQEMLRALSSYHDALLNAPRPPLFSLVRWVYDPAAAKDKAIRVAFQTVDSLSRRFLW